jgi:hypothetical protein
MTINESLEIIENLLDKETNDPKLSNEEFIALNKLLLELNNYYICKKYQQQKGYGQVKGW